MTVGGWDVFVSYGHEDAAWVRVLAGNLHRAGLDVFVDEWELVGGDRVTGRLEDAIRGSVNGVLVVSPRALELLGWRERSCRAGGAGRRRWRPRPRRMARRRG